MAGLAQIPVGLDQIPVDLAQTPVDLAQIPAELGKMLVGLVRPVGDIVVVRADHVISAEILCVSLMRDVSERMLPIFWKDWQFTLNPIYPIYPLYPIHYLSLQQTHLLFRRHCCQH